MGISASRRVKTTLSHSTEFNSACDSAYAHCLSLTEHAFQGVFPYELPTACDHIHSSLDDHPLILKWVPHPPSRSQIDSALTLVLNKQKPVDEWMDLLDRSQFKEWALVLYAEAVVGNARRGVMARVSIGVLGIVGVGAITKSGKGLVGAAVGLYALGVASSIYFGLHPSDV